MLGGAPLGGEIPVTHAGIGGRVSPGEHFHLNGYNGLAMTLVAAFCRRVGLSLRVGGGEHHA